MNLKSFDELLKMTPDEITAYRIEKTRELIAALPPEKQQRFAAMQWRIDQTIDRAKNPVDALVKLQGQMWDSVHELNEALKPFRG